MINENSEYFDLNEDNWSTLGKPVSKKEIIASKETNGEDDSDSNDAVLTRVKSKRVAHSPILTFQLIICLLFLTLAYVSKTFFLAQYESVKKEYDKELTASMIFDGKIRDAEYDSMFVVTSNED